MCVICVVLKIVWDSPHKEGGLTGGCPWVVPGDPKGPVMNYRGGGESTKLENRRSEAFSDPSQDRVKRLAPLLLLKGGNFL